MASKLDTLLKQAQGCRVCAAALPHGCRPVLRASSSAKLLIVGQAPGRLVHETGIPWNDPSGDRLRQWLRIDRERFYDVKQIAIVPMGFCFPGTDGAGGDRPPRPECAPLWHPQIMPFLKGVELTLLVGSYSQAFYLGRRRGSTMTDTVRRFADYLPQFLPLPHPSWRNTGWIKRNPWFEEDLLPVLRRRVRKALGTTEQPPP
ncbi:uracil-DNA glycosylase [Hypericibacter terrae]|jgi:uracil-DNA glycosylase|uniref:Uracil-DNA glycosylase n=1 Tax=Hypericibacter terrae TaxID=2602015 RepID=A0A5J6MYM8_9PROT|nr:uracil-DNA glycosylase family protein [Hypericibacter terrae]QEX19766.1 uracil-DNA glycosylase [Hypericibacter terrae]